MTAYLAPQFDTQFFDGSNVAAGYKLYTYESGTTTPKAVYSDQAGTVPHTNPIVLDANGRVTGQMFLGSGEYTFTLKTDADVLVKTWNDVAGSGTANEAAAYDAAIRADLASTSDASKGASLVSFIQSGVSTVWRTAMDKLRERISAHDFGATSTATVPVDDTTAINKAIAASPKNSIVELDYSRISVTPAKPGFDTNLAAFQSLTWKQNLAVRYRGPAGEVVTYSDTVAADSTPVNEFQLKAPYYPAYVLDVMTAAAYNNVPQATHMLAAAQGSTTSTALSHVYRKNGNGQASSVIRDSTPTGGATFTASIAGTTMTVTAVGSGALAAGQFLWTGAAANGVVPDTTIISQLTGAAGSTGTYTVSFSQTMASQSVTSGLNVRRWRDVSEVGAAIPMITRDLITGFLSFNSERLTPVVPHEFGGQVDIATGSQVNSSLSSFNADPYLRLNDNNTFVGGLKIEHANTRLAIVIESSVTEGTATLALPKNAGFMYAATYSGADPTAAAASLGKNSTSLRSLNATGNGKFLQGVNGNTFTTAGRNAIGLAATDIGTMVYDTTLGKPVWLHNNVGPVWHDASGASV